MSSGHRHTNGLSLIVIMTVSLLVNLGCQTGGASPAAKKSVAAVPQEINFFDVDSFDSKLSKALSSGAPDLTVTMLAPVSLNDVPERLDKWFSAVEKYEGQIQLEPEYTDDGTRSVAATIFSLAIGVYENIRERMTYQPAEDYNTVVYYDPYDGNISRIVFVRKAAL